ncbi:MAG TPA: PD-(D/E)XK nuclease family protein [Ktedonobacteraceae bacterium]
MLTAPIDLLFLPADGIDLIDFKTHPRQGKKPALVEQYKQQLYFYAHALEQHHGQRPNRLFLYWTAEERKENALMEIPYQSEHRHAISNHLDIVVSHIEDGNFRVRKPPAPEICHACDIRNLCKQDSVI